MSILKPCIVNVFFCRMLISTSSNKNLMRFQSSEVPALPGISLSNRNRIPSCTMLLVNHVVDHSNSSTTLKKSLPIANAIRSSPNQK